MIDVVASSSFQRREIFGISWLSLRKTAQLAWSTLVCEPKVLIRICALWYIGRAYLFLLIVLSIGSVVGVRYLILCSPRGNILVSSYGRVRPYSIGYGILILWLRCTGKGGKFAVIVED